MVNEVDYFVLKITLCFYSILFATVILLSHDFSSVNNFVFILVIVQ